MFKLFTINIRALGQDICQEKEPDPANS